MLRNYLKIAWRNLLKNRLFSVINVVGLAVSMAVCLLVMLLIADQRNYDRFHTHYDRIYRVLAVGQTGNEFTTATSPRPLGTYLSSHYTGIETTATLVRNIGGDVFYGNRSASGGGYFADGQLLRVFNFGLAQGNAKTVLQNPFSLVIAPELAAQLFPRQNPLGKLVRFNDTGLMPGVPESGNRETPYGLVVQPLADITPGDAIGNMTHLFVPRSILLILSILCIVVMLSACLNYTSLSVARALTRAKEVGVRNVMGASRSRIFGQFIAEAVMVALVSLLFCISLLFIISALLISRQTSHLLTFDYGFDQRNVLNIKLYKPENYARFVQAAATRKDVLAVGTCTFPPATGSSSAYSSTKTWWGRLAMARRNRPLGSGSTSTAATCRLPGWCATSSSSTYRAGWNRSCCATAPPSLGTLR
jgi:hypothetical protein